MFVDFGSGYNPQKGYKTCDSNFGCDFYSLDEINDQSIDIIRLRNVIHHIEDISEFFILLKKKLKDNAKILIIDCNKHYFNCNVFLDWLWYRWMYNRNDIYIRQNYFDYIQEAKKHGFQLKLYFTRNEKEFSVLTYKKK